MPWLFTSLSIAFTAVSWRLARWRKTTQHPDFTPKPTNEKRKQTGGKFHPAVQELQRMIEEDPDLYMGFRQIFEEIPDGPKYMVDALGRPQIKNYDDMLKMLDEFITYAPEFGEGANGSLVPIPLDVKMNWPMCTPAGLRVFTNPKVNAQLKKILDAWGEFLSSPESRYILTDRKGGWFSPAARETLSNFEETYQCHPTEEYWGFTCWDDFFTRKFRPGVRPVSHLQDDAVITSACESVVYRISHNVQGVSPFWLKGQPYSLYHMLNHDPLSSQFVEGTVYQAYLSAFNYHRWHSPVSGTIVKIVQVPGLYCAVSPSVGFEGDEIASVACQGFMTSLATRILIFIEANNPGIGLMCFIAVGLTEVSSCEATVVAGQRVQKGDELGMFHYGGSTHCLVFRPETNIVFSDNVLRSLEDGKTGVLLNTTVGYLSNKPR